MKCSKVVVMVAGICDYIKNHWITYFKKMKYMYINYIAINLLKVSKKKKSNFMHNLK